MSPFCGGGTGVYIQNYKLGHSFYLKLKIMKTEIKITNGLTIIVLKPENPFEERMLEDGYKMDVDAQICRESIGQYSHDEFDYELRINATKKAN